MLKITIKGREYFDEKKNEFVTLPETTLSLEHSLVSISKWESKYCKPFLGKEQKTYEETMYYIKCMTINPNVDDSVYLGLSQENLSDIRDYINAPMSATTFSNQKTGSRQVVTSELIYFNMVTYGIPFECQKWHIRRLLNLITICDIKNSPQKKMSRSQILSQNRQLNAARRSALNTKG